MSVLQAGFFTRYAHAGSRVHFYVITSYCSLRTKGVPSLTYTEACGRRPILDDTGRYTETVSDHHMFYARR
jgi:hypothetical protein